MQLTELHLALLAAGLGFVLLVWAANLWQERTLRRKIERTFGARSQDVLLDKNKSAAERIEPMLGADIAAFNPDSDGQQQSRYSPVPASASLMLDDQIDCIVELQPERPLNGELLNQIAQRLRHAGSKPILFEGMQADAETWERPENGAVYTQMRAGILLANRAGALNAIEFSDFTTGLEAIANDIGALPDYPAMQTTLVHAQKLDAMCAPWDAQISLNVLLEDGGRYSLEALQSIVANRGYIARADGKYLALDPQNQIIFTIALTIHAPQITLLLDVPRANPDAQPFARMSIAANDLAQALGGNVVDDTLRPLSPYALHEIDEQLQARYQEMEEAGVAAGSALALRLFN
ncbi:MAG: hypothetical protein EPO06_01810 [Burkholderiaceae bacterium]|nr:MAG: hypothetical protein EPO06_01810 [Burkholderiaceae bacterium]